MRRPHELGRRGVRQLLARRKDPGHCLCLQAAHGRPALPAIPTLNPPWLIQFSMKMSQTKVCVCERRGPRAGVQQVETCASQQQPMWLQLGLAWGRRGSWRDTSSAWARGLAKAGESQAIERSFEFSYLVPANSPCSEGEELRWGPE